MPRRNLRIVTQDAPQSASVKPVIRNSSPSMSTRQSELSKVSSTHKCKPLDASQNAVRTVRQATETDQEVLPATINAALLILRIACAMAFLYHGSAILFGAFAGPGPQQFAASHHWPAALGYLVGLAQFGGGLAVLSGILFRLGAACIVAVMMGAIFLVHLPNGFNIGNGGAEYALTQLLLAVTFLLTGPGAYSLASWLPVSL
jgi:putative oxidoreductase